VNLNTKFNNGQIVFLITDSEQSERIITAIQISANNGITYQLGCGSLTSWHYECEMACDKDIVKSFSEM
jgi:hypothetical protein